LIRIIALASSGFFLGAHILHSKKPLLYQADSKNMEGRPMRMTDDEYFRSCVAQERHLAHLLGHHEVEEFYESAGTLWDGTEALPKWTRDWKACGPLLTGYELTISYRKETGEEHSSCAMIGPVVVRFSDHPTRDRALMYGIVKAVIHLLEHPNRHGQTRQGG
jgi:hypothetical protein